MPLSIARSRGFRTGMPPGAGLRLSPWYPYEALLSAAIVLAILSQEVAIARENGPNVAQTPFLTSAETARDSGRAVFMQKCWGCHHEDAVAFGPAFQWIGQNRTEAQVRAQILNPATSSAAAWLQTQRDADHPHDARRDRQDCRVHSLYGEKTCREHS